MLLKLVVLAIVACAYAAPKNGTLGKIPDQSNDQQGCYIEEIGAVVAYGEKGYSSKPCAEYTCSKNGVSGVTCPSSYAAPPCKMVIHENESYPNCCPKWVCP